MVRDMEKQVNCRRCRQRLSVPREMLGKWVRCPHCRESFHAEEGVTSVAPASSRPAPPPSESVGNAGRARLALNAVEQNPQTGGERVISGLKCMYVGLVVGGWSFLAFGTSNLMQIIVLELIFPELNLPDIQAPGWVDSVPLFGTSIGTMLYVIGLSFAASWSSPDARGGRKPAVSPWLAGHGVFLVVFVALAANLLSNRGSHQGLEEWILRGGGGHARVIAFDGAQEWSEIGQVAMPLFPLLLTAWGVGYCFGRYIKSLAERLSLRSLADRCERFAMFQTCWLLALYVSFVIAFLFINEFHALVWFRATLPLAGLMFWLLVLGVVGIGGGAVALDWTLRMLRTAWNGVAGV